MSKKWSVGEPGSVYDFLRGNDKVQIGDTIEYVSNNQEGWKKYKVVIGNDGKNGLNLIADYNSMMDDSTRRLANDGEETDDDETDDDEATTKTRNTGGKRRRRRKTMRKTKRRRKTMRKTKRSKKTRRKRKTRRGKKH